jgi:hypothetical protein
MTATKKLPMVLKSITFNTQQYEAFKIERPYSEERYLIEWRKDLGILRTRFHLDDFFVSS